MVLGDLLRDRAISVCLYPSAFNASIWYLSLSVSCWCAMYPLPMSSFIEMLHIGSWLYCLLQSGNNPESWTYLRITLTKKHYIQWLSPNSSVYLFCLTRKFPVVFPSYFRRISVVFPVVFPPYITMVWYLFLVKGGIIQVLWLFWMKEWGVNCLRSWWRN